LASPSQRHGRYFSTRPATAAIPDQGVLFYSSESARRRARGCLVEPELPSRFVRRTETVPPLERDVSISDDGHAGWPTAWRPCRSTGRWRVRDDGVPTSARGSRRPLPQVGFSFLLGLVNQRNGARFLSLYDNIQSGSPSPKPGRRPEGWPRLITRSAITPASARPRERRPRYERPENQKEWEFATGPHVPPTDRQIPVPSKNRVPRGPNDSTGSSTAARRPGRAFFVALIDNFAPTQRYNFRSRRQTTAPFPVSRKDRPRRAPLRGPRDKIPSTIPTPNKPGKPTVEGGHPQAEETLDTNVQVRGRPFHRGPYLKERATRPQVKVFFPSPRKIAPFRPPTVPTPFGPRARNGRPGFCGKEPVLDRENNLLFYTSPFHRAGDAC